MSNLIMLLISLAIILVGAVVFTNGLEWFGEKKHLSDGAVGSIFAAVGTAMPETLVPIVAILFGSREAGHKIGVGAIIGAPFMLGTLAFFVSGLAVMLNRGKRGDYPIMRVDTAAMRRDMEYFLALYGLAIGASFLGDHHALKGLIAVALFLAYGSYVRKTIRCEDGAYHPVEESDLAPCYFAATSHDPPMAVIAFQVLSSLLLIVWGSYTFVEKVQTISQQIGVSPFILAMIIAPIATELPEKFNSVIWINKGKDALAVGNVTGAMVFQSSVITALGILITEWRLNPAALLTVALTFATVGAAYGQIRWKGHLTPGTLLVGGVFYAIFLVLILVGGI